MFGRLLGGSEHRTISGLPWEIGQTVPSPLQEGGTFISPVRIGETAALRVATVWRCVWLIADAIAAAPVDVYRKEGDIRRPLPTPQVLTDPAGGAMTSHDWYFSLMAGLLLAGNAYAFKAGLDRAGYPTSLPLLDPTQIQPRIVNGRIESYRYAGENYPAERILHLRAFTLPGRPLGLGPLEQFGQTIGMAAQAERFAYKFFSEFAVPSGIVYSDKELSPEQAATIKQALVNAWRNRREPGVLGSGLKYEKVSASPSEAQFIESQQFSIEEICRVFGVDPRKVGHAPTGSSITYANIEQAQIAHQIDTVYPWASRVETALSSVLPKPDFVKLNLDAQVRVDITTRYEAHVKALDAGFTNIGAVAALEDETPTGDARLSAFSVDAAGALVRAGFEPEAVCVALGLPPIKHTGLVPVTVQPDRGGK